MSQNKTHPSLDERVTARTHDVDTGGTPFVTLSWPIENGRWRAMWLCGMAKQPAHLLIQPFDDEDIGHATAEKHFRRYAKTGRRNVSLD